MRRITFHPEAFEQFTAWVPENPVLFERIARLIAETARDPFHGLGKPEPLRHQLKGSWSRRINEEHRLVYPVTAEALVIASCRFDY